MHMSLKLLCPKESPSTAAIKNSIVWKPSTTEEAALSIDLPAELGNTKQIVFHGLGDYFATLCKSHALMMCLPLITRKAEIEGQTSIWIHQISKRHSQSPFRKVKGIVQKVLFHPKKPVFYVAVSSYLSIKTIPNFVVRRNGMYVSMTWSNKSWSKLCNLE